jgi:hypothetical protein
MIAASWEYTNTGDDRPLTHRGLLACRVAEEQHPRAELSAHLSIGWGRSLELDGALRAIGVGDD